MQIRAGPSQTKALTPSSDDFSLPAPPRSSMFREMVSSRESNFIEHMDLDLWKTWRSSREARDPRWLPGTLSWSGCCPVRLLCHLLAFFPPRLSVASPYQSFVTPTQLVNMQVILRIYKLRLARLPNWADVIKLIFGSVISQ